MLLEIVAFATDIGPNFVTIGQTNTSNLAEG
jgi:hypothetical protein